MKIKHLVLSLIAIIAIGCNSDDNNNPDALNYSEGISVNSQAALDSVVQSIGPDRNALKYLIIGLNFNGPTDITSLASLSNIVGIESISIQNCPQLTSLEGLHNVREAGIIGIGNTGITDLNGLRSLATITGVSNGIIGPLSLFNNSALVNLNGLQKLTNIPTLSIAVCSNFQSFHGLENCRLIGSLTVNNCPNLISLENISIEVTGGCQFYTTGITTLSGVKIVSGASVFINFNPVLTSFGNAFENATNLRLFICEGNPSLVSLEGLETLTTIGEVDIRYNDLLQSLNGLQSVTSTNNIGVTANNSLLSLNGLHSLTTANSIRINYNPALTSIGALSNVTSLHAIGIGYNPSLTSLNGIENISSESYYVTVESNASLKDLCTLVPILSLISPDSSVSGNYNPVTLSTLNSGNCSIE